MLPPVVMIVFNRPDLALQVFARVRAARPGRLLLIADGPRDGREGEAELCRQTRAVIEEGVDWPCELQTCYADRNMGCVPRCVSGLTWVFERVDRAIVLEDDCLPDPTFFDYCGALLDRHEGDPVSMISGTNLGGRAASDGADYFFSRYPIIWGWSTWADRWRATRAEAERLRETWPTLRGTGWLDDLLGDRYRARCWSTLLDSMCGEGLVDWGFDLTWGMWRLGQLAVAPSRNLVSNIGFDERGHSSREAGHARAELPTAPCPIPPTGPRGIAVDEAADGAVFDAAYAFLDKRDPSKPWWRAWYKLRSMMSQET